MWKIVSILVFAAGAVRADWLWRDVQRGAGQNAYDAGTPFTQP
jgi:hypothetical protein